MPEFSVAKGEVVAIVGRVGSGEQLGCGPAGSLPLDLVCACWCLAIRHPAPDIAKRLNEQNPSGKSSILQALLSKMTAAKGSVKVGSGAIAYVPQTPWVQNLTLRENILFGLPYDEARYGERAQGARGPTV